LTYSVPFGRGSLAFEVPSGFSTQVLESVPSSPVSDARGAIERALQQPVAGPRLRDIARATDRVVIVVTDITRDCPDDLLVPALLDELDLAKVPVDQITVVVGIGLHRSSTPAERLEMFGQDIVDRVRIVDPDPIDPACVIDLGVTAGGVPATINRLVWDADLVVATGVVEPHQYAGYSGGRKTVAIGCAGERTIEFTHSPAMLDHPRVRLGVVEGNPFHEAVSEIAQRVGLRFIINVVMGDDGQIVSVQAGEPSATFDSLVRIARALYTVPLDAQVDVAVAGVGYPKDSNLYQASRAASYLYFAPRPVVRPGGVIIVPAPAPEGVGAGVGEQRYLDVMRSAVDASAILADARQNGYKPGAQRAFVMARVLEECAVVVVGAADPSVVRDLKMLPAATMTDAFDIVRDQVGNRGRALVVPHALHTLPIITNSD
jgi:lactate racemase